MAKNLNQELISDSLKVLSITTIAGLASVQVAQATTIDEYSFRQKPLDKPTLDYLNEQGYTYNNGISDEEYPQSAYTLTKTETITSNTVTKYVYDNSTGSTTSNSYDVSNKTDVQNVQSRIVNRTDNSSSMIEGNFLNLSVPETTGTVNGGAINNDGRSSKLGYIIGDFVGNHASTTSGSANGGAIYLMNGASIKDVVGDFVGNYAQGTSGAYGGAVWSKGVSATFTGDFVGNYVYSTGTSQGGAIYNYAAANITGLNSTFSDNKVTGASLAEGGAIYNGDRAQINALNCDFLGNSVKATSGSAQGGALYNGGNATLGAIVGDFVMNSAEGSTTRGGAIINNNSTMTSITGNFIKNYASSTTGAAYGGAIHNTNKFTGDIIGNFISNYTKAVSSDSAGGAIHNTSGAVLNNLTGNFVENYAETTNNSVYGGAIFNAGTIGQITGNFEKNYAIAGGSYAHGGAIYSKSGSILGIAGDFIGNSAQANLATEGGAIWLSGSSSINGDIVGDFINNKAFSTSGNAQGGAIYNSRSIGNIIGDFKNNSAISGGSKVLGGAISNSGSIKSIQGDFESNYIKSTNTSQGGAIYNNGNSGKIELIDSTFVNNKVDGVQYAEGGAIFNFNNATISELNADFIGNTSVSTVMNSNGAAIYNNWYAKIGNIKGDFIQNTAIGVSEANGGAITNNGGSSISSIDGDFIQNSVTSSDLSRGGAVFNSSDSSIGKDSSGALSSGFVNSSFVGNYSKATSGTAYGGAIYTESNINMFVDGEFVEIRDNYTDSAGEIDDNAIYVNNANATLTIDIKNKGELLLDDNIDGVSGYNVDIKGDGTGALYLYNDIKNADVSFGALKLDTRDGFVDVNSFNSLKLSDKLDMAVDVDLASAQMDRLSSETYTISQDASINVININMLSEMKESQNVAEIYFADQAVKDIVSVSLPESNSDTGVMEFVTPVYKYNAIYDNRENAGYFVFAKGNYMPIAGGGIVSTGKALNAFNPAVLGGATSATAGALSTMNQTYNYSFQNVDSFMNLPRMERLAIKNRNKYAIAPELSKQGVFSPLTTIQDNSAVWVKPYASFGNVPLKNGPKVSNITYGTLIGFDSEMESIKNGWDRVFTGFIGYNGASQRYSGVDSYQNGGVLGGTMTLYKGNFFNSTTINTGASVASNTNMYGSEDFAMLTAGIGNKSGYNFEFKEGRVILQPSMLMAYTFVNTFDYTNSAGVRIDNKPLHALQLIPGLKLIGNTKNGWQPYASVSMVWNVMGSSDSYANGIRLPQMSLKPYVQYGVGIQKRIKDKFMAYAQAMIMNGGINGVSLSGGFRWALGKDSQTTKDKVEIKNQKSEVNVNAKSQDSKVEQPVKQEVKEVELPKVVQPVKQEVKQVELPKVEQPVKQEVKQVELPKVEQPEKQEVKQVELPKVVQPVKQEVKEVELPKVEQPEKQKVKQVELPKVEQPVKQEVKQVELPKVEQPLKQEVKEVVTPKVEQPIKQEVKEVELPKVEQPLKQEVKEVVTPKVDVVKIKETSSKKESKSNQYEARHIILDKTSTSPTGQKKIIKQMSTSQKIRYNRSMYNTTRTNSYATLRQI